ncbi:MAG: protein rep [Rhodanobacter sp.]|jgi:hypothetical protein
MDIKEKLKEAITEIEAQEPATRWLFVSIGADNCANDKELTHRFKQMERAWGKLDLQAFATRGWFKVTEVSSSYLHPTKPLHPHYHALLAVRPEYFAWGAWNNGLKWSREFNKCLDTDMWSDGDASEVRDMERVIDYLFKPNGHPYPKERTTGGNIKRILEAP